jgi:cytochrome d ubiquinol oxidase subunit I
MGRQPWVVYDLLRTADALSESVTSAHVMFSLIFFTLIYILLLILFFYLLDKKIRSGPYDESDIDNRLKLKDIAAQFEQERK